LTGVPAGTPLDDWDAFAKATGLKKTQLKKIRPFITETDPAAKAVEGESDPNLRDTENIPFLYEGGIDAFIEKEVRPYAPDAWVDGSRTKIGYEISFTKYFYKPAELRSMKDILASLTELEKESDGVMEEILEGLE
jgi:type I restriction enzyme M protein